MTATLPKKLKIDAILEAVFEVRFEPDPNTIAEVLYGRFADTEQWREFRQARLPTADIPTAIRRADPNLRYQPAIELVSSNGDTFVRIGPQVLIYGRRGTYPGWQTFGAEIVSAVNRFFQIFPAAQVSRLGLRYINALRTDAHQVAGIKDMDIAISVGDAEILNSLNLNFKKEVGSNFESMSRIATIDLAEGVIPKHASVIVDIDVYTGTSYSANLPRDVAEWVEVAHLKEKERFFEVLGREATERLREE